MLCFVVVIQSFIMNSHEVFIHIHQGCFAGTGAIVRLPQCQWSKPDGYGKISQCITTTKHSKANNRVHISWDILYSTNFDLTCFGDVSIQTAFLLASMCPWLHKYFHTHTHTRIRYFNEWQQYMTSKRVIYCWYESIYMICYDHP